VPLAEAWPVQPYEQGAAERPNMPLTALKTALGRLNDMPTAPGGGQRVAAHSYAC
jgi:hypothetical protein